MDMKDTEKTGPGRTEYEPELVKYEVLEVCDYYLRERRKEGRRYTYRCPECSGRRFEVEPVRAMAGCFSAECGLPKTTDAIGIIGHMEDLDTRGAGFIECLKKGYEILGLDAVGPEPGLARGGEGRPGPKARSWIAGEATSGKATPGEGDNLAASEPVDDEILQEPAGRLIEAYTELLDGSRQPLEAFVIEEDTGETLAATSGPEQVAQHPAPSTSPVSGLPARRTARTGSFAAATPEDDPRETNHRVYERLLAMCPLEDRDREFLKSRGLDEATINEGRFGSISKKRSRYVTERLDKRFDNDELLSVPGFYRAESGQFRFTLYGDYVLIPYYDREGYILTVEGRLTGKPTREGDPKYKALSGSGVHLYVHPRFDPGEVVAFCEGAVGAMVAARCGIPVAAIKGMRNYRQPPEGRHDDYSVLPGLAGVDFAGKEIVYVPDLDVKPKTREEAFGVVPEACEWLIERQGGRAKVARLPEGAKDLDEWLLSLPEEERVPEFMRLLREADAVEDWVPGQDLDPENDEAGISTGASGEEAVTDDKVMDQSRKTENADREDSGAEPKGYTGGVNYRDLYFKPLPDEAPKPTSSRGSESEGSGSDEDDDSTRETPEQPANRKRDDQSGGQGASERESTTNNQNATQRGDDGTHSRSANSAPRETERGRRADPAMQWWYDVSRQTTEQVRENRRIVELRDRVGYRRPQSKSARIRFKKWEFGEVVIALAVTVMVAIAACVVVYLARSQGGLVATLAGLITFPIWWVEATLYLVLGWGVAVQVAKMRYVSKRKQLVNHLGGEKG